MLIEESVQRKICWRKGGENPVDMRIGSAQLTGAVTITTSKSYCHRALIAAALGKSPVSVAVRGISQDIEATVNCLNAMGAEIEKSGDAAFNVVPIDRSTKSKLEEMLCESDFAKGNCGNAIRIDAEEERGKLCNTPVSIAITNTKTGVDIDEKERYSDGTSGESNSDCTESGCKVIDCGESGSTLRFLMPVAAALGIKSKFVGEGRLPERPVDVIAEQMESHGVKVVPYNLPLTVEGQLTSGEYELPGNISSQFITGLLFALPILSGDSVIRLTTPLESKAYVDITIGVLKDFGIEIEEFGEGYKVKGNRTYEYTGSCDASDCSYRTNYISSEGMHMVSCSGRGTNNADEHNDGGSCSNKDKSTEKINDIRNTNEYVRREFSVKDDGFAFDKKCNSANSVAIEKKEDLMTVECEGDWSNAAFWLAAGVTGKPILCRGLTMKSAQGDKAIVDILRGFGGRLTWVNEEGAEIPQEGGALLAQPPEDGVLKGCDIDASQIPDLVPIISVVMAAATGTSRIYNAARLRIKESDRLAAMCRCMEALGVAVAEQPDGLTIQGSGRGAPAPAPAPAPLPQVSGFRDHRIVMSAAVAAAALRRPLVILGAEAVAKSYPTFFEEFRRLGGDARAL